MLHLMFFGCVFQASAIPASPKAVQVIQPDGTSLTVWMKGDEFSHYAVSTDGYTLLPNDNGYYTYATTDSLGSLRPSDVIAHNVEERDIFDLHFLATTPSGLTFSASQKSATITKRIEQSIRKNSALRSTTALKPGLLAEYPTTGSPKSLVILVNFKDVSMNTTHTATVFDNMQNKSGYSENGHVGSVRDYYQFNSGGLFNPDFVVVGPVTVSQNMSYYGGNDSSGNDKLPAVMVQEACQLVDSQVDFSQFDADSDGTVDNVYVYYAGLGEADGGSANTIWPHSYSLSSSSISLTLDGKKVDSYACSAELKSGTSGSVLTGIGTFTHEYGHILGLTDMYDVDYDSYNGEGFDLNYWSLMASGSYNGDGCIPPCLSLLERTLLGWATPTELSSPAYASLEDLGSSNKGFIIKTSNSGEYFMLENRQKTKNVWDSGLYSHGLLIYHVDMRSDATIALNYYGQGTYNFTFEQLWLYNLVNAKSTHQCNDLEEADNKYYIYDGTNATAYLNSLYGDPFPGSTYKRTFTDTTLPSMKTWSGVSLNKPITDITETNQTITFAFMGGSEFTDLPAVRPANDIKPFSFKANWGSVENATGYYLSVYTRDTLSGIPAIHYVSGYEGDSLIKDTASVVRVPYDLTEYSYQIKATNGFQTTGNSDSISLRTTDATPLAKNPSEVNPFSFVASWKPESWATGYYLDVYTLDTSTVNAVPTYLSGLNNFYTTDSTVTIKETEDQSVYYYCVRSTTGYATSKSSNIIALTTARASEINAYVKDRVLYLKGVDKSTSIKIYDLLGQLRYSLNSNSVFIEKPGLYLVEAYFKGGLKKIKVLVP
jgi:M6 family metalloprotease-like protein